MNGPERFRWDERSYPEIESALAAGAVAILPVGAVEPHGPHLPLSADVVIAEEMARRAAGRLATRGVRGLILPPVAYSVADWSEGFTGRISLPASTASALVRDVCVAALSSGARQVALANAHLEPAHVACLREACREVAARGLGEPIFPDLTRRSLAQRLGADFLAGDHAGRYETSLVMASRPDLVREEVRQPLPPVPVSLVASIREGAASFRDAGLSRAYCGDPASASAAEGDRLFEVLADILEQAIVEALGGAVGPGGNP